MSNNPVTFENIKDAAEKLSNAVLSESPLKEMNPWGNNTYRANFLDGYEDYYDQQGERGYGLPYDLSWEQYQDVRDALGNLCNFVTFMNMYFIPYYDLVSNNLNLISVSSQDFFTQKVLAPLQSGSSQNLLDVINYLSCFSDIGSPGIDPTFNDSILPNFLSLLTVFSNWDSKNAWYITLSNVATNISPASDNSSFMVNNVDGVSTTPVTFSDIKTAANNVVSYFQTEGFSALTTGLTDLKTYLDNLVRYSDVPDFNNFQKIVTDLQNIFLPYYTLVLNNQGLLSNESLNFWNYHFNAATIESRFDKGLPNPPNISTSFIASLNELAFYPTITKGEAAGLGGFDPHDRAIATFYTVFKNWKASSYFNIFSKVSTMLTAADQNTLNSVDFATIAAEAATLAAQAADPELTIINNWTGISYIDFQSNYEMVIQYGINTNYYTSIEGIMEAIAVFAKFGYSFMQLDSDITSNPSVISTDSLKWWNTNFKEKTLIGLSYSLVSVYDFVKEMIALDAKTNDISDEGLLILTTTYYFTPWNDSNPIRKLLIDAVNNIKPA